MKKISIVLFLMMSFISFSQNTDIILSTEQSNEIRKGLEQAEYLKAIIQEKDKQIAILEKQLLDDLQIIKMFQQKVENLESINRNNKRYIEYQEQEMGLKIKKEKNKRFGIGIVSGYGFSPDFKSNAFVGLGLSYSIFRL